MTTKQKSMLRSVLFFPVTMVRSMNHLFVLRPKNIYATSVLEANKPNHYLNAHRHIDSRGKNKSD
jgi:hypothetical protein